MTGEIPQAYAPMSVTITIEDDIDISRGDMIVRTHNLPEVKQEFDVMLCWLNSKSSVPRAKYTIMHANNEQKAIIKEVVYKIDINTMGRNSGDTVFKMNDIGRVTLRTTKPLMLDTYRQNRVTGSIILVDEGTNETVAAGMVV